MAAAVFLILFRATWLMRRITFTSFHMERSPDYFRRAKDSTSNPNQALSINRKEKYVVVENLDRMRRKIFLMIA
jgi:hypothetical protein